MFKNAAENEKVTPGHVKTKCLATKYCKLHSVQQMQQSVEPEKKYLGCPIDLPHLQGGSLNNAAAIYVCTATALHIAIKSNGQ